MNNHLTLASALDMLSRGFHPMPGRTFIHLDPLPAKIGSIHVPDTARELQISNTAHSGRVLAVSASREEREWGVEPGWKPGDRVWLLLYDSDRGEEVIITRNEVICAVVEPCA